MEIFIPQGREIEKILNNVCFQNTVGFQSVFNFLSRLLLVFHSSFPSQTVTYSGLGFKLFNLDR